MTRRDPRRCEMGRRHFIAGDVVRAPSHGAALSAMPCPASPFFGVARTCRSSMLVDECMAPLLPAHHLPLPSPLPGSEQRRTPPVTSREGGMLFFACGFAESLVQAGLDTCWHTCRRPPARRSPPCGHTPGMEGAGGGKRASCIIGLDRMAALQSATILYCFAESHSLHQLGHSPTFWGVVCALGEVGSSWPPDSPKEPRTTARGWFGWQSAVRNVAGRRRLTDVMRADGGVLATASRRVDDGCGFG